MKVIEFIKMYVMLQVGAFLSYYFFGTSKEALMGSVVFSASTLILVYVHQRTYNDNNE